MFDLSNIFKGMNSQGGAGGGWAAGTVVKPEGSLFTQGLDGAAAGLNNKVLGAAFQTAGDIYSKQHAGKQMHPLGAFAHGMAQQQPQGASRDDPRETIRRLVQQAYMQNQQG